MRRRRDRCRSHWATTARAQGPPASQCNAPTVGRRRVARHLPRSRPRLPWPCHQSNRSRSRPRRDRCRLRLRHISSRTRSRPRTRAQRGPPRRRKRSLPTIRVMRMGCCFRNARPRGRRYAANPHPKTVASFHTRDLAQPPPDALHLDLPPRHLVGTSPSQDHSDSGGVGVGERPLTASSKRRPPRCAPSPFGHIHCAATAPRGLRHQSAGPLRGAQSDDDFPKPSKSVNRPLSGFGRPTTRQELEELMGPLSKTANGSGM